MRSSLPAAATIVVAVAGCGSASRAAEPATHEAPGVAESPSVPSAFVASRTRNRAAEPRGRYETARIVRRTGLRAAPGGRVLARLGTRTEFGSPRVLAVTGRRAGWLRVIAAERRNGRHGWIRAAAAHLGATDVALHVDRSRRQLTLLRGRRVLRRMPIAVGRAGTPTPTGRFAVTDRLHSSRPDSPYGCCALALSGHQTRLLPGWPGGDRLAIHGTPNPETVGTEASLGCLRAHDKDIRALMRAVPLGAPVFVRA